MPSPTIQLALDVKPGPKDTYHRMYFNVQGSPSSAQLVAEQDRTAWGWLERFAQACYERGREDLAIEARAKLVADMTVPTKDGITMVIVSCDDIGLGVFGPQEPHI